MRVPSQPFRAGLLVACSSLSACASLPSNGPTARQVIASEREQAAALGIRIVDVRADTLPPARGDDLSAREIETLSADGRVDLIGPGDVLGIAIYEVGTTLFASGAGAGLGGSAGFDPSARAEAMPGVTVDRDGRIRLPYIGQIEVAGRTTSEVARLVERGLAGKSQQPQVVVAIRDGVTNTVLVSGAVVRPGRQRLTLARERLLDAIAAAGGTGTADGPQSTVVRVTRGTRTGTAYLEAIAPGSSADIPLLPGDRIDLIRRPRSFTVFGAAGRVSQIAFDSASVSLDEAMARAGGPDDNRADPTAVFVFRYEPAASPTAAALPTIYRLDMLKPSSYFVAQRFTMRDKDVVLVANARANQARKFVEIVNQLFSPVFLARQATR